MSPDDKHGGFSPDELTAIGSHQHDFLAKDIHTMRMAQFTLVIALGLIAGTTARAATIDAVLPLDTATSELHFSATLNGKQIASATVPFSGGSFDTVLVSTGTTLLPLELTNVGGEVDAGPFKIHTVLGNISASGLSLAIGPDGGPFLTTSTNPAHVNLAGLPLSLDHGTITAGGHTLANFANHPVNFKLPTTIATFNANTLSLSVPVNAHGSETFDFHGHHETLAYSLTGAVNFSGPVAAIPEPSTFIMTVLGGCALLAFRGRRGGNRAQQA